MTAGASGEIFVGLMSGTSLDGIDAVLVDFSAAAPRLIAAHTFDLPAALHNELLALCQPGADEIERLGRADRALGTALGDAVTALLARAGIRAAQVRAIGSHGQTVRHRPVATGTAPDTAFTLQIGDPHTVAERTGITTVADFRRRDIAAGGQGAPLVPAFHRAVFGGDVSRVIVNIGGMANITALPAGAPASGFDTGPGNVLLDHWCARHRHEAFDRDGCWAATGQVQPALLQALLADPFLQAPPPKSTGREHFNAEWLERQLADTPALPAVDVQATLAEFTATTIADAIGGLPFGADAVFVCGGGARNRDLMARLTRRLAPCPVSDTTALGIAPEWVEAAAFAWLARETLAGRPGNEPAVTGAAGHRILGAIFPA